MIPKSHHGAWHGRNRLWLESPDPERSDSRVEVHATDVHYTWSFRGQRQEGRIRIFGPDGAVRAEWNDSFHAKEGMTFHGHYGEGVLVLFGTYPAGDEPEWGWRIEIDVRDPEHFVLRMFNIQPGESAQAAVDLRGER